MAEVSKDRELMEMEARRKKGEVGGCGGETDRKDSGGEINGGTPRNDNKVAEGDKRRAESK